MHPARIAKMGRKNKLRRFEEMASLPNVFEADPAADARLTNATSSGLDLKGSWAQACFHNDNPIILELGCGKGDYTLALARSHPSINFIGIDIKGARMWVGAHTAMKEYLHNVAFLRTRIEFIDRFFTKGEVSGIWITFPDPFEKKPNRRLSSPPFLDRYRKIARPGSLIHLKTDSTLLYEYTLDVIYHDPSSSLLYANPDIYTGDLDFEELHHQTYYEKQHLASGRTIKYIRFTIEQPTPD